MGLLHVWGTQSRDQDESWTAMARLSEWTEGSDGGSGRKKAQPDRADDTVKGGSYATETFAGVASGLAAVGTLLCPWSWPCSWVWEDTEHMCHTAKVEGDRPDFEAAQKQQELTRPPVWMVETVGGVGRCL